MTQNELQVLVDELAMRTGAPTVLEDHEQRMIVYSAQDGPIDEVRRDSILMRETSLEVMFWFRRFGIVQASAPLRIPSHPELGILGRWCVPVRFRGRLLGFLFLIDNERRLDSSDIGQVEQAVGHAGLLLCEDELAQRLIAYSTTVTPAGIGIRALTSSRVPDNHEPSPPSAPKGRSAHPIGRAVPLAGSDNHAIRRRAHSMPLALGRTARTERSA